MERTLVLLKPDSIQRELVGNIINRFERKGMKIVGLKMSQLDSDILVDHYKHISDKPFFPEIRDFMSSTPVVCMAVEGVDAISTVREMAGVTLSRTASNGSVRGDLAMSIQCNLIHTSDSLESAEVELARFFNQDEIFEYNKITDIVIYSSNEK
jgi:nucleoside-diphosphate kinase